MNEGVQDLPFLRNLSVTSEEVHYDGIVASQCHDDTNEYFIWWTGEHASQTGGPDDRLYHVYLLPEAFKVPNVSSPRELWSLISSFPLVGITAESLLTRNR